MSVGEIRSPITGRVVSVISTGYHETPLWGSFFGFQYDAHVDVFRQWERGWYGPEGKGPSNLGSGRTLHDELSFFYLKCASHALVEGDKDLQNKFTKARTVLEYDQKGTHKLPAVNVDLVLKGDEPPDGLKELADIMTAVLREDIQAHH